MYASVDDAVTAMISEPEHFETPEPALVADYRGRYVKFTLLYPALRAVT